MTIKDLVNVMYDKVQIYEAIDEGFKDIYKGNADGIPKNILSMVVCSIGASKKNVLDICVK